MRPVLRFLGFLLLLFLFGSLCPGQKPRKLEVEWLAKDVRAIESVIPTLLPAESQSEESIKASFGDRGRDEIENLGFGARKIVFSLPNGYTSLNVNLFTLNGVIEDYSINVSGSSESWPLIRSQIIEAWRKSGAPDFQETDHGLSYRKAFDPELLAYKKAVAAELGEMRTVQVPAKLRDDYEYLVSPFHNSVVGSGGCGYGGTTPAGKDAIDALMKANRVDLAENVLKGFNPGGRVYAALALLALKNGGFHLSDEAQVTINKISRLDIKIETCSGCIITARTALEILYSPEQP